MCSSTKSLQQRQLQLELLPFPEVGQPAPLVLSRRSHDWDIFSFTFIQAGEKVQHQPRLPGGLLTKGVF